MKQTSNAIRLECAEAISNPETLRWEQDLRMRMMGYGLSRCEQEIALLAIRGLSNREIANLLCVCEQTVKDHLFSTFSKLTIHRRSQLATKLLSLPSESSSPGTMLACLT